MRGIKGQLCLVGLSAVAALSFFAVPAQAALRPFVGIAALGKPTGNLPPRDVVPLDDVCGLAVDSDEHLYLSDYHPGAVQIYDGAYLTQFSTRSQVENSACGLAVDSAGNLYANNLHQSVVRYTPDVYPFKAPSFPIYSTASTIAADRSTGIALDPATEDLYVTHRDRVSRYEAPVLPGDTPTTIGDGALGDAYGTAVSGFAGTLGNLYVADAADNTVKVFDPATDPLEPIAEIAGSEVPLGEFRDLTDTALAVNDVNGHLFVVDNLQPGVEHPVAAIYEFDASGEYLGQLPGVLIHGAPSGLVVDGIWIFASTGNESGSAVYRFCAAVPATLCAGFAPNRVIEVARTGSGEGGVRSFTPGIDCGTICAWEYDEGSQVSLAATPRPHSTFTGWTVTGQPGACPGTGTCKVTLSADTEVSANFQAIPQKALMVSKNGNGAGTVTSSPAGIDCGAICIAGFDQGSTVTLTAEAAVGSEFAGWSGAGCAGTSVCQVPMGSEQSVSAEFRAIPRVAPVDRDSGKRTLAVSVSGEGAGTITSDPAGIECGTPCSNAYAPGTKVTLTAKPDPESAFTGWSRCDSSKGTTCTVTLGSSRTVGASFAEATPLEIGGVALSGARATLSVVVPSKGTLSAKAKQIKPVSAKARKAETLSLPLSLNKAGKKALAKKDKLKVKVTLTFKPQSAGEPRTLEKTITFRKKATAKRASRK